MGEEYLTQAQLCELLRLALLLHTDEKGGNAA